MTNKVNPFILNNAIWSHTEPLDIDKSISLLLAQVAEISEHLHARHTNQRMVNELCDIMSISARTISALSKRGPSNEFRRRLRRRHQGQTREIVKKYAD